MTTLPEFAGLRNGRFPTRGEYWPIRMPGNAGFTAGASAPLPNDLVTTASRYEYEPSTLTRATFASPESSTPLDLFDCEFTYAPKPDAAAAAAGTPTRGSVPLLTYSSKSRNSLLKYA